MATQPTSPDFPEYSEATRGVWNDIAEWWDDRIGDGNTTQDLLVEPTQERLLDLKPGEDVLDIACGAGRFTRRMAKAGVRIVAFDHAERFINQARQRTVEHADRIAYRVMSATDPEALVSLGEHRFDAAVCTMALMDMAAIHPLLSALPKLLKPGGRFVWSVTHPVFNSGKARMCAEEHWDPEIADLRTEFSVRVIDYLDTYVQMGVGIKGQPRPQHYFHRPVHVLLNACFEHGFVMDRFEEPALPPDLPDARNRPLNWVHFDKIPQILVVRMRMPA